MRSTLVGYVSSWTLVAGIVFVAPVAVGAKETEPVVEKLEHGEINWTEKVIIATGSGAPNLKLPNVAAIRLNAERAAKTSAYRNILETLEGVRITARMTGKQALAEKSVRTQVSGLVKGCRVVDTRYYSDGGVDVVLRCPLDGGLATSLAPVKGRKVVRKGGEAVFTGLIVDASGLKAKPALQPRILDTRGEEVYAAAMVSPNDLRVHGAALFVKTVEAARAVERIGAKPLVLKAVKLGETPDQLVVSADAVSALRSQNQSFLAEGKVVIVTGVR